MSACESLHSRLRDTDLSSNDVLKTTSSSNSSTSRMSRSLEVLLSYAMRRGGTSATYRGNVSIRTINLVFEANLPSFCFLFVITGFGASTVVIRLRSTLWRSRSVANGGRTCLVVVVKRSTKSEGSIIRSARYKALLPRSATMNCLCSLLHQRPTL